MDARLGVAVLGAVAATFRGEPVRLGGPLQRALLARLAIAGPHQVSAETLIADLWERPPPNARHTLQVHVSRLRAALPVDVERIAGGYRLGADGVDLDATRFARLSDDGRERLREGSFEAAASDLREGLALWRGPALADLTGFVGLRPFAVRLDEQRQSALADRIDAELAGNDPRAVLAELRALVIEDHLAERHWAQLMTALHLDGRQNEALDAYRQAREHILDGLGSEPGRQLRAVHEAILRGDEIAGGVRAPASPAGAAVSAAPSASVGPPAPAVTPAPAAPSAVPPTPSPTPPAISPTVEASAPAAGSLAGRARELAVLERAWSEAARGLRIVAITGEAGIGKTRLATEFGARAEAAGVPVRHGRCHEGLEVAYQPIAQILRADAAGLDADQLRDRVGADPSELGSLVPELAGLCGGLAPSVVGESPGLDNYRTWEAVTDWLVAATAVRPQLLVIDDLHWSDPDTARLLEHLARTTRPIHALILLTYRDSADPRVDERFVALVRQSRTVSQLPLRGLEHDEVTELLAGELHSAGADPSDLTTVADWVATATAGNPLFVLELARRLAVLIPGPDAEHVLPVPLPSGLRGIIHSRVERLPDSERDRLQYAAVIGREFDPLILARVVNRDAGQLDESLQAALHARLIEPVPGPRLGYTFCHDVVRIALYESVPPIRRARLHLEVAEAIEKQYGADATDHVHELAHHYAQAATVGQAEPAVHYLTLAGNASLRQRAPTAALDLYRRAGQFLPAEPADGNRCDLLLATGLAEFHSGDPGYRETLLAAARLANDLGDTRRLTAAVVANSRGWYSSTVAVDDERVAIIEAALAACVAADTRARCQLLAAWAVETVRDPARRLAAVARSGEGLALAERLDDELLLAEVLSHHYAVTYAAFSDPQGCAAIADRLSRIADTHSDLGLQLNAALCLAQSSTTVGDFATADRALDRAAALGDRLDQPARLWMNRCWQATRVATRGDLVEAERLATAAFEFGVRIEQPDAFTWFGGQLFTFRLMGDRLGELIEAVEEQVARYAREIPAWRAAYAVALVEVGRIDEAAAILDELVGHDFAPLPVDMLWLQAIAYLAMVCVALGRAGVARADAARAIYDRLVPYRDLVANNATIDAGPVQLHLGLLARLFGDTPAAESHLLKAIELCRRGDAAIWLTRAERELELLR